MEKVLPLYLGPSVIGSVSLSWDERRLLAVAKTYVTLSGICRAYIKSSAASLLVGVLTPDGAAHTATHTFTKATLSESGIVPEDISYAYALCKEGRPLPDADTFLEVSSPSLFSLENKSIGRLVRSSGARVDNPEKPAKIAVPLFTGRPFPATDILCLMTPVCIDGEVFGVVGINENGNPKKI